MKIDPPLFNQSTIPLRAPQVSEARRAFEAMLSANSARQIVPTDVTSLKPPRQSTPPPPQTQQVSASKDNAVLPPLERPGRVLDIRV